MSRAVNNGWDFVKVGKQYQYKEDWFIAMVTILEDNSDEGNYRFKLRVDKATEQPPQNGEFEIMHDKTFNGVYSGMIQLYETEEYSCHYDWVRGAKKTIVKIEKVEERKDALYPNNKEVGYVKEGDFIAKPEIGKNFWVGRTFRTSLVQEIIDDNTFKTDNSVYKWTVTEIQM